jgi:hypothetical protein
VTTAAIKLNIAHEAIRLEQKDFVTPLFLLMGE